MKMRITIALIGLILWVCGAILVLDQRFPPNLARYEDRSVTVLAEDQAVLRAFLSNDDKWRLRTDISQVDPLYLDVLKTFEDKRFDSHWGVDPLAVLRATWQWVTSGQIQSGASTLTMQTARLLEPRPRTIPSKLIEMARALQLEAHFSKDEILSIYLTLAPFGGNLEGVRAASLSYFGKEPVHLSLGETALLVSLPQSPERYRPDRNTDNAASARKKVLYRLSKIGQIAELQVEEAKEIEIPTTRKNFPFYAPRLAQRLKSSGSREVYRTHINKTVQVGVENLLLTEVQWTEDNPSIAVIVVENDTRKVIAYAGGADFWAPGGQLDLAVKPRSPGSALKPFIYGLAFDDLRIHPETLIDDKPMVFGTYAPRNFARNFQGTVSIRQALRQSLNVPAVALLNDVGPIRFASILSQHGTDLQFSHQGVVPSLPLALGGVGISLYDLTQLYVALANGGQFASLQLTEETNKSAPKTLLGEAATWYVTDILRGTPMPEGWAQRFGIDRDRNVAFKTGTSYGFRDAWAVGYSGSYTVGVWIGRADGSSRTGHFGLNTAAPVLLKVFAQLPGESRTFKSKPLNTLSVQHTNQLPLGLRHFTSGQSRTQRISPRTAQKKPPKIRFPSDGVAVALPESQTEGLLLKAVGGTGSLRWMVNGQLLPQQDFLSPTFWHPKTTGFASLTVIDSEGRTDHANIRLVSPADVLNNQ